MPEWLSRESYIFTVNGWQVQIALEVTCCCCKFSDVKTDMGGHAKHGLGIQCENRKIFTWELPESNFLYLLDPKDIKLGGVN